MHTMQKHSSSSSDSESAFGFSFRFFFFFCSRSFWISFGVFCFLLFTAIFFCLFPAAVFLAFLLALLSCSISSARFSGVSVKTAENLFFLPPFAIFLSPALG